VTYSLPPHKEIDYQKTWDQISKVFRELCRRPGQGQLLALDWQHTCYELTPAEAGKDWLLHPVPEGEYRYGLFGHPC
jgi:hypothetical protein